MDPPDEKNVDRLNRRLFWLFILLGYALPWATGAGVKLYLDARGEPTFDWSYFLDPLSLLVYTALGSWFAVPFIGYAFLWRFVLAKRSIFRTTYGERLFVAICGFVTGSAATIGLFLVVFVEFPPVSFIYPGLLIHLPALLFGLVLGFILVLLNRARMHLETGDWRGAS